ncbi:hypothetical protein [Coleofasciculus sp. C1-SOL-03]|jgi:site-specific DNA-methyltransferase (adenine-specific)|uniref:hypothetical protein n=1 Tax=Coleofasciculus sp. C1-SOL-03 TaxID=3069522 RepID=UPI0040637A76
MVKPAPTNLTPAVSITVIDSVQIEQADALTRYWAWQAPTVIISDGAYGLGLFPGDPPKPANLAERINSFLFPEFL